ncbi:MAG: zinc ABC transporter solute-binding protein [Gammaproteobacteria bacterium]|nr:zinc ABC transporter solute-binding protein [Gammaproteobacteria bacterium]
MIRSLLLLLLLPGLALANKPLSVFVSVPPIKTFVEKIGGKQVEVHHMVRPGHNPATYNPTPRQISQLAAADIYFRVGVPFEQSWMQRIEAANTEMHVIDTRKGLKLRSLEHHHGHDDHDQHGRHHNSMDPHIWTSPLIVQQILQTISQALSELLPEYRQQFEKNRKAYQQQLIELDEEIHHLLEPHESKSFLVFHPGWGYFADTYHLRQVVVEQEGKEPGAHSLAQLIKQAKQNDIQAVFVQPQFSQQMAGQIANAINGRVITIDPLSENYIPNLRQVAHQLAETW